MITSRDRTIRTLNHEPVDRAPRDLRAAPGVAMLRGDELEEMRFRYSSDIVEPEFSRPRGQRARGTPFTVGTYTDAWGCTYTVRDRGAVGRLVHSPLADLSAMADYELPLELLAGQCTSEVNRSCASTSRFVLARAEVNPFERLGLLRGNEAALVDMAASTKPIRRLLAMIHDFFCREMEFWAATDVDGVAFSDTIGLQSALRIESGVWRNLLRPLYRDYVDILHRSDKFVFFTSGANITPVFGDLVEIGVDAVNCPMSSADLEQLSRRFRGEVTFWGEIDRHRLLPFGTPDDVRKAVFEIRRELDFGSGGVIAQCQWEPDVPFENVVALFEQWLEPMLAHA